MVPADVCSLSLLADLAQPATPQDAKTTTRRAASILIQAEKLTAMPAGYSRRLCTPVSSHVQTRILLPGAAARGAFSDTRHDVACANPPHVKDITVLP